MAKVLAAPGNKWVMALIEALGEDPRFTRALTIHIRVGDVVTVDVERYVTDNRDVIEIIKKVAWEMQPQNDREDQGNEIIKQE